MFSKLKRMFGPIAFMVMVASSSAFAESHPTSAKDGCAFGDSLFIQNMEKISCEVERIQVECRSLNADSLARKTTVTLLLKAHGDSSKPFLWSGRITREKTDTLRFEQAGIPIRSVLPAQKSVLRGLWRWTEPALVLATLSGLVYMFYSVRSR